MMGTISAAASGGASSNRLVGIEAGRGIAASLVVLYHVSRHLDQAFGAPMLVHAFQFGHSGVDFFFVISGFIILFVHYRDIDNPLRLGRYVGRRFTRLFPTYWVALALTVALSVAGHHSLPALPDLALSASLLPADGDMVLGVAWTLRFEILFYILFGVLIVNRIAGLAALAVWFSAAVVNLASPVHPPWLPGQFYDANALQFCLGMAAAYLLRTREVPRPRLIWISGVLLFGVSAVAENMRLLDGYGDIARLTYGIPAAMIVLGIAEADRKNQLPMPPFLRSLGAAWSSIYLFQFVFIGIVWQALIATRLDQRIPVPAQFLALASAAIIGGILTSRCVEYPLIRLLRTRPNSGQMRPTTG